MNLCRFILTCTLLLVGVSFLLKQTDYIGLLMDGVALVFIVEIANILYAQVLRPEIRDQTESLDPMEVPAFGIDFINRRPALRDMLQLTILVIVIIIIMESYYSTTVGPLYESL